MNLKLPFVDAMQDTIEDEEQFGMLETRAKSNITLQLSWVYWGITNGPYSGESAQQCRSPCNNTHASAAPKYAEGASLCLQSAVSRMQTVNQLEPKSLWQLLFYILA